MEVIQKTEQMASFLAHLEVDDNPLQKEAFQKVASSTFPTTKDEYWKYTRLGKLAKASFKKMNDPSRLNLTKHIISNDYIVLVNGYIREDLSQYSKLDFEISFESASRLSDRKNFNAIINKNELFANLNTALFNNAIVIRIDANKINEGPLQIISVTTGNNTIANTRVLIEAGKSSQSEIIQTFVSKDADACFTNHVLEAFVAENAHLTINKSQTEDPSTFHISTEQIAQDSNSVFKINTVSLSGALIRNNINIAVDGQNCETHMNGAIVTKDNQVVDNHTFVDHKVSNCFSNENYKYVLDGKSTGVFNGRVVVEKDAQVINAYQNNGNILLSDSAQINSKPELEIYADDVKCSHGSTTGQLDEEAVFYLQTRGLSKENAKKLLVRAFVNEILEEFQNEQFSDYINGQLSSIHSWNH